MDKHRFEAVIEGERDLTSKWKIALCDIMEFSRLESLGKGYAHDVLSSFIKIYDQFILGRITLLFEALPINCIFLLLFQMFVSL